MDYNHIKDLCYKRGGLSRAIILAMHSTKRYKLISDELVYMKDSRDLLRDEVLHCYSYLMENGELEDFLNKRDGIE